jgi:phosphate transport system substrate-binding protein
VEGVIPDYKSIQSRSYPYTTEVYAVVRTDQPHDSLAYLIRDWVLTADGQATVTKSGYVPLR